MARRWNRVREVVGLMADIEEAEAKLALEAERLSREIIRLTEELRSTNEQRARMKMALASMEETPKEGSDGQVG